MIVLSNTRADPGTMMIEFPHAFPTIIAMLGPILDPAVTDLAIVPFIFLKVKQLIFLQSAVLISWIFSCGEHEICIGDEERDEWDIVDGLVLEKIVVFV